MASFFNQAQAIWKTLDEMRERDPDEYQKFIREQLAEGEKIFGSSRTGSSKFNSSNLHPGVPGASFMPPLSLGREGLGSKSTGNHQTTKSSSNTISTANRNKNTKSTIETDTAADPTPTPSSTSLTDDVFQMSSLLTSIVNLDTGTGKEEDSSSSSCGVLKELKLPGSTNATDLKKGKVKRPLIEEL